MKYSAICGTFLWVGGLRIVLLIPWDDSWSSVFIMLEHISRGFSRVKLHFQFSHTTPTWQIIRRLELRHSPQLKPEQKFAENVASGKTWKKKHALSP
jgi:hypothetical protein